MNNFVSRAGNKLEFALDQFKINVQNKVTADFGSSTGGFVDCLLKNGALKVYAVDTAYGELDWNLRNNPKVVVLERTNAMHVVLPEKVDLITIDVAWTTQEKILPNAIKNLKSGGIIISLAKPHYEANKKHLFKGKLQDEYLEETLNKVKNTFANLNLRLLNFTESPIEGKSGGNREYLALLKLNLLDLK